MLLIPPLEQLIARTAAALYGVLIALAAAGMLNPPVADHNLPNAGDQDFIRLRIARELIGYSPDVAIVTTEVLFLTSRPVNAWGGPVSQCIVSRKLIVGPTRTRRRT